MIYSWSSTGNPCIHNRVPIGQTSRRSPAERGKEDREAMSKAVIAIVFDFDETLGPDTISFVLEQQAAVSPKIFWKEVEEMVSNGWDLPLAYMHKMLQLSKEMRLDLSKRTLARLGKKLPLFPGLPEALKELKNSITQSVLLKKTSITLEIYIISGGLEELIQATGVALYINGIFGSTFAYEKGSSQPYGIRSAISFTEKTRFLHGIRKGINPLTLRADPHRVNNAMPKELERIPFSQIIYIGDGPSDIPCLSAVMKNGGVGIGVTAPFGTFRKGYELAWRKRITVGPYTANYKKGSDMRKVLEETILRIGLAIDIDRRKKIINSTG